MGEIHDTIDNRNISINNVGITDYVVSFTFKDGRKKYHTIANIKSGVSVDKNTKGAHLSRINMTIDELISNKELNISDLINVAKELSKNVGVNNANIKACFTIVFQVKTPQTLLTTNMHSNIELYVNVKDNKVVDNYISLSGNVGMLCPNSKSKSRYGAHSQKCNIVLTLYDNIDDIIIFDYYKKLCMSGSAPVFGVVRSDDESYMTELAYDNPKFSEDAVRDLIISVRKDFEDGRIKVELKNLESIHQHNVFCIGED